MSAFVCIKYHDGRGGYVSIMAADTGVDCSSEKYRFISILAIISTVAIVPTCLAVMLLNLLPIRRVIEQRTKRAGVSPIIDFLIARYSPKRWYFAVIDMVR